MKPKKAIHFLYSLKKSWPFLLGVSFTTLILVILSFIITDSSCHIYKNLFAVLISLFCGIIVSLCTSVINIYQNSVSSYNRVVKIVSDAVQKIESEYISVVHTNIRDYIELHFEYTMIYREMCFSTDSLTYVKDYKLIAGKFKAMVEYLCGIKETTDIQAVCNDLSEYVKNIRTHLELL